MIESALISRLNADPALSTLVATRLYPLVWPDDPKLLFPLVTWQRISTVTENILSGPLSMATVRMQFDAWGKAYADVKAVTAALNAVLERFQGSLPDGTLVDNIVLDTSFDLFDSPSQSYRVSSDYLVTYLRS